MKQSKKSIKKSNSITNLRFTNQAQHTFNTSQKYSHRRKTLQNCEKFTYQQSSKAQKNKISIEQKQIQKLRYQMNVTLRINESLIRQNQTLKKQLAFFNQFNNSSRRSSIYSKKNHDQANYKQKILNRLNQKREAITTLQNESTQIHSRTNITKTEQNINQVYEDFSKKRIIPSMNYLLKISSKYFQQFKDNYVKLRVIFDHIKHEPKTQVSIKMQDLLGLFQVPILYKQNPKGLFRSISKQRIKSETQNNIQQIGQKFQNSLQTLKMAEQSLKKILKSSSLFQKFKKTEVLYKLIKKLQSN